MKQNIIIVLLAVVATLLLVNLIRGNYPPSAQAAIGVHEWVVSCGQGIGCFAVNQKGRIWFIGPRYKESMGVLK